MCFLPTNEKFVIFLHPRYFETNIFKSICKKIKNNLENKGIVVFNIKTAIQELKKNELDITKKYKLLFDDNPFPNCNMLYCHLFNGQYYNDTIYIKKKVNIEREMLILLSGKLGVQYITYETEITETVISKVDANINIKGIKNGISYSKTIDKKEGMTGKEEYLNRGAPVYLKSTNIQEVEKNIKEKMGTMESNVFNYEFYKHNPKLESFVYKRFEFKMLKLEYTIDTEDISDVSFVVKSCFIDYGINLSFNSSVTYNETIKYTLEFFTDKELKKEYFNTKRSFSDQFFAIKEQYDCLTDKDLAVHYIGEYVSGLTKKCYYRVIGGCGKIYNFSNRLTEYINNNPEGTFESICHHFCSTLQIKNWIYKNLTEKSFEIVEEEEINNVNNTTKSNKFDSIDVNNRRLIKTPTINKYNERSETYDAPIHSTMEQYMANMSNMSNTSNMRRSISFEQPEDFDKKCAKPIETIQEESIEHTPIKNSPIKKSQPMKSVQTTQSESLTLSPTSTSSSPSSPSSSPKYTESQFLKNLSPAKKMSIIQTQLLALMSEQINLEQSLKLLDIEIKQREKSIEYNKYALGVLNEELIKINDDIIKKEEIYNEYINKHKGKFTKQQDKKATELKNILTIDRLRLRELESTIEKKKQINILEEETLLLIMEDYDNIIIKKSTKEKEYKKIEDEIQLEELKKQKDDKVQDSIQLEEFKKTEQVRPIELIENYV